MRYDMAMDDTLAPPLCRVCGRKTKLHERYHTNGLESWFECRPWWRFWKSCSRGRSALIGRGFREWGIRAAKIMYVGHNSVQWEKK